MISNIEKMLHRKARQRGVTVKGYEGWKTGCEEGLGRGGIETEEKEGDPSFTGSCPQLPLNSISNCCKGHTMP